MRVKGFLTVVALACVSFMTVSVFADVSDYLFKKTLFPHKGFFISLGLGEGFTRINQLDGMNVIKPGSYPFVINNDVQAALGQTGALNSGVVRDSRNGTGLTWTAGGGYQFSPNFAVLGDFYRFHSAAMNLLSFLDIPGGQAFVPPGVAQLSSARISKLAFDIDLRGMFQIKRTGMHLYGKAGLGYLQQKINNDFFVEVPTGSANYGALTFKQNITTLNIGAGLVYYIANNFSFDVNWNHFFGHSSQYAYYKVPDVDYFGFNLIYTFRLTDLQN